MKRFLVRVRAAMRVAAVTFGAGGLLASALLPAGGCNSGNGVSCDNGAFDVNNLCCPTGVGVIDKSGVCQPKCVSSKCKAGNVCVDNQCALQCTRHADCATGQACTPATGDDGKATQVCSSDGHLPTTDVCGGTNQQGKACPFGQSQCDPTPTPSQCGGAGASKSADFTACPNGLECDRFACNGNPSDCKADPVACAGLANCNVGKCKDGSACTVTTCPADQCAPFRCISAGEGDANAYCAHFDCAKDDDCGPGAYCGYIRDPRQVCGTMKGNDDQCGKSSAACVSAANGGAGVEGPVCWMRRICRRRDECAPCASNVDCSAGNGDVCVTVGASKACAHFCTADANCRSDQKCVPAGNVCAATPRLSCATAADCPTANDTCVPRNACVPRSGGCHAENAMPTKFCYACTSDVDCGDKSSTFVCASPGGGERACLDSSFGTACMTDKDCPTSPSGAHGRCLDDSDGVPANNSAFHHCYFPRKPLVDGENNGYSCYP